MVTVGKIDRISRPTLCCILSSAWFEWQQQENTTINQLPLHTIITPTRSLATTLEHPSSFEPPIMQTVFQQKQKLYTFADKLQSVVVGLGQQILGNGKGYLSSGLIRIFGLETPRVFFRW